MNRVKLLLVAAIVVAANIFNGASAQRRIVLDKVVAVVGNSSILQSEVDGYALRLEESERSEGYTSGGDYKAMALEELMTLRLLANQARLDSVYVNLSDIPARVEYQLDAMREAAGGTKELEREQNMEIFNIREMLKRRAEEQAYAQSMRMNIVSDVNIVPGEVERFYNGQSKDSLPMVGEQYRYAQIIRFPSTQDDAKRRVREQLLEIRERIISGTTRFSVLAQMYSVDPGSAYRGGEMEPQPASAFVPEFAEALQMLQEGQVSEIVETEFGYHIVELIERKGELFHCRHILLRPSYSSLELQEPVNFLDSLVKEIRRDMITFERAALLHSDDGNSKMNGGVVSNQELLERYNAFDAKLTVTKFLKEDFGSRGYKSLEDYLQLSRLEVGGVSNAFTTEDMVGTQMAKIVKLLAIYPPHVASLEEDYLMLESLALDAKKEDIFEKWLDKHIEKSHIRIDPAYQGLKFKSDKWLKDANVSKGVF